MCDPLGRYLLLPLWFTEDFEEESFASSLGIFFFFWYRTYYGRIFCFLTRDCLNVLRFIREESFASSMGMMFLMCLIL